MKMGYQAIGCTIMYTFFWAWVPGSSSHINLVTISKFLTMHARILTARHHNNSLYPFASSDLL